MKKALVPLAPGFEEIEALTAIDILRRAGAEVIVAGTIAGPIEGRSKIKVVPDTLMDRVSRDDLDMIVLPGGAIGADNLNRDPRVKRAVKELYNKGKFVAAICAAPKVLSAIGLTEDHTVTSHPSVRHELKGSITEELVVVDRNIITSQAPGTAMEFAFKLVEALFGPEKTEEVKKEIFAGR